jgi:hypothetical protein
MRFSKAKIILIISFLVVGMINVPAAHAASSMEIYFEPAYSGEPFKVAVTLGALPKQAMLKDICVLSGGANSFYPQSIRIVNMRGFWTFAPPPINQKGTYLVAFTCEGVFSVLNVEKTLVVIDRPTPTPVVVTPTPTPTPVVVTPTPTPTPVVVTPTPTPTPVVVTPTPSAGSGGGYMPLRVQVIKEYLLINESTKVVLFGLANDRCTIGRENSTQTTFNIGSNGSTSFTFTAPNTAGKLRYVISCAKVGSAFFDLYVSTSADTQRVATPTPAVATPTPAVATPTPAVATPTPAVATPTPAVATPTPAAVIKPGTTKCTNLGEVITVGNRKVACAQNASRKSLIKWEYISFGTLCYTEGLFVRPYKCRYPGINKTGQLQFMR